MKRFFLCLSLCCLVCLMGVQTGYAETPPFQKCYGTSNNKEVFHDICSLNNTEPKWVAVGYQFDSSVYRYGAYIVKIDNTGQKMAETIYNGPDGTYDCIAHAVVTYSDNNYKYIVVTGAIRQYSGQSFDMFAVKYKVGDYTFEKVAEEIYADYTRVGWNIILDPNTSGTDQDFFISGETDDLKMCVVRIHNGLGEDSSWVYSNSLTLTAGYSMYYEHPYLYVCGKGIKNGSNTQALVVKLQPQDGGITYIYSQDFGGNYEDIGYAITKGYYNNELTVAGKYGKTSTNSDYWFLTMDTSLNEVSYRSKIWGSTGYNEELHSIDQTLSGTFVVAGRKDMDASPATRYYTYLSGRYTNGSYRWEKQYGSGTQSTGNAAVQLEYRNHYIAVAGDQNPGTIGAGDGYVIRYWDNN